MELTFGTERDHKILSLLPYDDPLLRTQAQTLIFPLSDDEIELIENMVSLLFVYFFVYFLFIFCLQFLSTRFLVASSSYFFPANLNSFFPLTLTLFSR